MAAPPLSMGASQSSPIRLRRDAGGGQSGRLARDGRGHARLVIEGQVGEGLDIVARLILQHHLVIAGGEVGIAEPGNLVLADRHSKGEQESIVPAALLHLLADYRHGDTAGRDGVGTERGGGIVQILVKEHGNERAGRTRRSRTRAPAARPRR